MRGTVLGTGHDFKEKLVRAFTVIHIIRKKKFEKVLREKEHKNHYLVLVRGTNMDFVRVDQHRSLFGRI